MLHPVHVPEESLLLVVERLHERVGGAACEARQLVLEAGELLLAGLRVELGAELRKDRVGRLVGLDVAVPPALELVKLNVCASKPTAQCQSGIGLSMRIKALRVRP